LLGNIGLIAARLWSVNSSRVDFETPVSAALNNACRQLHCDIMILWRACSGEIVVVVNRANMAMEAVFGDDRRAEEIIRAKVGQ
jgi:hypothetical protein